MHKENLLAYIIYPDFIYAKCAPLPHFIYVISPVCALWCICKLLHIICSHLFSILHHILSFWIWSMCINICLFLKSYLLILAYLNKMYLLQLCLHSDHSCLTHIGAWGKLYRAPLYPDLFLTQVLAGFCGWYCIRGLVCWFTLISWCWLICLFSCRWECVTSGLSLPFYSQGNFSEMS